MKTAALTPAEMAAQMRSEFPTTLLSWGDALRLMIRLGLGKYDLRRWCGENPDGFKRVLPGRTRHHYSREFILRRALAGESES